MKSRVKRVWKSRALRDTRRGAQGLPQSIRRIENWDGKLSIVGLGAWYMYWRDLYHLMLTVP